MVKKYSKEPSNK